MVSNKQEQNNQFSIWIVASILLHLLIILVAFFWYLELALQKNFSKKTPILIQEKKQTPLQLQKPKIDLTPAPVYTLIPGRKAVTTPEPSKDIPKLIQKEHAVKPLPLAKSSNFTQKNTIDRYQAIKNRLLQNNNDHMPNEHTDSKKTLQETVPTISKEKVTLQDLKLGFSKFLQEGNNDVLIQRGNTNQAPDAQALRLITYNQQIARTMQEAICTHPHYNGIMNKIRGKTIVLTITIERDGTCNNMQILEKSNHSLLDKIVFEALNSIKLYPAIPLHISHTPYTMPWRLFF